MIDQMRDAYSQMQPGDKMVMHLHKAPAEKTQYQMPGNEPGQTAIGTGQNELPREASGLPGASVLDPIARRNAMMMALASMTGRM